MEGQLLWLNFSHYYVASGRLWIYTDYNIPTPIVATVGDLNHAEIPYDPMADVPIALVG